MNRRTRFIDHDNRKRAIGDPGIATKSTGEFLAMFDRAAGGRKLEACPASGRNAVPHIEIIGPHLDPATPDQAGWSAVRRLPDNPIPLFAPRV